MPFRQRQKMLLPPSCPVFDLEQVTNKDGSIEFNIKDQSEIKLPTSDKFDLGKILDAGIELEEVSSKILSGKTVSGAAVLHKYTSNKKEN